MRQKLHHKLVRSSDIVLVLVAILFPPAAAFFITGCSCDLVINLLLTILGYIPGHLHAFWLIYKNAQAEERYGRGNYRYLGNATWVVVGGTSPFGAQPIRASHRPGCTPVVNPDNQGRQSDIVVIDVSRTVPVDVCVDLYDTESTNRLES
ncbi:hypothetical protein OIO90_001504 [Microbotryomycetes sp. JL221]|nr:hypothetical protein OIO90_001504 [Microbotryomycetes sp. JL221]